MDYGYSNNGYGTTAVLEAEQGYNLPEPLNSLLQEAAKENATDIHLDPEGGRVIIRFRVDGIIHKKHVMAPELGQRLLNQIKVASSLEPKKTIGPMESQLKWRNGDEKRDIRVGIIPSGGRDAFHLRLLTISGQVKDVSGLGFSEGDLDKVSRVLDERRGLILITGPTGAGKTITMYSLASSMDLGSTIAVSIEDPVEFDLPFLRQVQVDEGHGLSMAEALRTFLRMDPDVILVGEIRDTQSAVTAARAALAGRMVLATVHANDAAGAIEGLNYLSVPYYILGGSVKLVMTQELVRRVCPACAKPRPVTAGEKGLFSKHGIKAPKEVLSASGCRECSQYGYRDRVGVYEVADVDDEASRLITSGANQGDLRRYLRGQGVRPVISDALEKVARGVTTMEEVMQLHWPKVVEEKPRKAVRKRSG